MLRVQSYREASREMLNKAREEMAAGDLRQASEKGWGAAAQILKAIAQQRGWEHTVHKDLRIAARQLSRETNDRRINRLYRTADSLHINWYENWDDAEEVADGLDDVELFIGILEPLLIWDNSKSD